MWILILKFKQSFFTEASFSSLSDIYESWVVLNLAKQPSSKESPQDWLVRLLIDLATFLIDLATFCDLNLKQPQMMPLVILIFDSELPSCCVVVHIEVLVELTSC